MSSTRESLSDSVQSKPGHAGRPPHALIRASAGSGKTFQLSNRYLQLILNDDPPEGILATTFTRKAAGEILQRIVYRLAEGAIDESHATALGKHLGMASLDVRACRRQLRYLTKNLHRMRVSTLDSFFLQATQTLSLELGLPPDWQIVDELEDGQLRYESLRRMLEHDDESALTQLLHWLAKGETTRAVHRLLDDTISQNYDLFRNSPEGAWQRLSAKSGPDPERLTAAIESLRAWWQSDAGKKSVRNAVEKDLGRVDQQQWLSLAESTLMRRVLAGDFTFNRTAIPDEIIPSLEVIASYVQAEVCSLVARQTLANHQLLARFHEQYSQLKIERRALRFDDLARYLQNVGNANGWQQLAYRMNAAVESILLDEFQDTSLTQWQVIRPLAQHAATTDGRHSFFCVGDIKQAIYGWRGGDAELLDAVADEISGIEDQLLDRSYRSARPIIDVVNQVHRNLSKHPDLNRAENAIKQWEAAFPLHATALDHLTGWVGLSTSDVGGNAEEEREQTVRRAAERVAEVRKRAPGMSIAILLRTNELVGKTIFELQRRGIAASEEGGNPLTDSAAVQLVMSLLQLIDHPQDSAARFHLAESPWGSRLGLMGATDDAVTWQLALEQRQRLMDRGLGAVVAEWGAQLSAWANDRERRRLTQLTELAFQFQAMVESPRVIGHHVQRRLSLSTADFREWIQKQRVADPTDDPVRVMTVHQSKGLQFDFVILPDLDRKLVPHTPTCVFQRPHATAPIEHVIRYASQEYRALLPDWVDRVHDRHEQSLVRESLSVMYVAMTRAVYALEMIIAPSRDAAQEVSTEKKKSKSKKTMPVTLAGLLRASLTDGEPPAPRQLLCEFGDPDWLDSWIATRRGSESNAPDIQRSAAKPVSDRAPNAAGRTPNAASTHVRSKAAIPTIRLAPAGRGVKARRQRTVSPSQLEGAGKVRLEDRLGQRHQRAMQHGTLIHAFFELVYWIDDGAPDDAKLLDIGQTLDADPEHLEIAIQEFRGHLAKTSVKTLLSRRAYLGWHGYDERLASTGALEVRSEQPLSAVESSGWIRGVIDRLVLLRHEHRIVAAEIIDYKTDAIRGTAELQQRVSYYRPQVTAYAKGVSRMLCLPIDRIRCKLLFLDADRVVEVPSPHERGPVGG